MFGTPIQFSFSSADATTPAPLTLRESGRDAVRTLLAGERVVLSTVVVYAEPTVGETAGVGTVTIADGEGNSLLVVGEGTHEVSFKGPDRGSAGIEGVVPVVGADSAGAVAVTGTGYITSS